MVGISAVVVAAGTLEANKKQKQVSVIKAVDIILVMILPYAILVIAVLSYQENNIQRKTYEN